MDRGGIDAVLVPDSVGAGLCTGPLWGHHGYQRSISLRVDHSLLLLGPVMPDSRWS